MRARNSTEQSIRHGTAFLGFSPTNSRPFPLGRGHDRATVQYGRKRSRIAPSTPSFSLSGRASTDPSRRWPELRSTRRFRSPSRRLSDGSLRTPKARQRRAAIAWRTGSRSACQFLSPRKAWDRLEQAVVARRRGSQGSLTKHPQQKTHSWPRAYGSRSHEAFGRLDTERELVEDQRAFTERPRTGEFCGSTGLLSLGGHPTQITPCGRYTQQATGQPPTFAEQNGDLTRSRFEHTATRHGVHLRRSRAEGRDRCNSTLYPWCDRNP
jgi:hypothetical protein